jgi:hypothetical protein
VKIAVVGPRKGGNKEAVEEFVTDLYSKAPDTILVSGGAEGVDSWAETTWLQLGGVVWSYRIKKLGYDSFTAEKWELGTDQPRVFELLGEPHWADPKSALYYRDMLAAEAADKVMAFEGIDRMRGTEFTVFVSTQGEQKETWIWRNEEGWVRLK